MPLHDLDLCIRSHVLQHIQHHDVRPSELGDPHSARIAGMDVYEPKILDAETVARATKTRNARRQRDVREFLRAKVSVSISTVGADKRRRCLKVGLTWMYA